MHFRGLLKDMLVATDALHINPKYFLHKSELTQEMVQIGN